MFLSFSTIHRFEGRIGCRNGEDSTDGRLNEKIGRRNDQKRRTFVANDSQTGRRKSQVRSKSNRYLRGENYLRFLRFDSEMLYS